MRPRVEVGVVVHEVIEALSVALITHLRKLEEARYLTSEKVWDGNGLATNVTLTTRGRAALDAYTEALRNLLGGLAP